MSESGGKALEAYKHYHGGLAAVFVNITDLQVHPF
jgi:hypothetical protein